MITIICFMTLLTTSGVEGGLGTDGECKWAPSGNAIFSFFFTKMTIHHPPGIKFTWEPIKGSHVMHIENTDDIIIKVAPVDPDTVHIEALQKSTSSNINIVLLAIPALAIVYILNPAIAVLLLIIILSLIISSYTSIISSYAFVNVLSNVVSIDFTTITSFLTPLFFTSCRNPSVHAKIPIEYIETLCINGQKCMPTVCKLGLNGKFEKYSTVDSKNRILFSDEWCTIKKPNRWDEWIFHHFNTDKSTESYYLLDSDNDGLVNILEYYADESNRPIDSIGSDPNKADSDGDLLLDGFEYANGLPTKLMDSPAKDSDNDKLTNLDEQIHHTDPLNPDSDGDGVADGIEVLNNADPNDPWDNGEMRSSSKFALIKLTVGDFSGSHSERYTLNVGKVSHQSPGFGLVGSGVYQFPPGSYKITVQWVASNLPTPDYDYRALIQEGKRVEGVSIKIEDPLQLLGDHDESGYDYTIGKTATLIVEAECENNEDPSCHSNCEKCQESGFRWEDRKKRCYKYSFNSGNQCPCDKCKEWYENEKKELAWLEALNHQIQCPCKLIDLTRKPASDEWESTAVRKGAQNCIRSKITTRFGGKQECCYDENQIWIKSGSSKAAGTPIKHTRLLDHQNLDLIPYHWCCEECQQKEHCDFYIKNVRKGPNECKNIT